MDGLTSLTLQLGSACSGWIALTNAVYWGVGIILILGGALGFGIAIFERFPVLGYVARIFEESGFTLMVVAILWFMFGYGIFNMFEEVITPNGQIVCQPNILLWFESNPIIRGFLDLLMGAFS